MQTLAKFLYSFFKDSPDLRGEPSQFARGSMNLIPLGTDGYRPFLNCAANGAGSRLMFQVKDGYGGLDDVLNPETGLVQKASGSLISAIADTLFYIGFGQVSVDGTNIVGAIATNLLRILLKWNNSYTDAESGPYVVGLTEPSAPEVGAFDTTIGGTPTQKGIYSFRSARLRESTGGKSRASAVSKVLTLNGKAAYAVAPLAATAQTRHIYFVTEAGLGGTGLHFRIPKANPYTGEEYRESDIERTITTLTTTNGSAVVTSSVPVFTAADRTKRFQPGTNKVGSNHSFSVPAETTVLTVNSATQITLSNPVTHSSSVNTTKATLISFVARIDRSIILNWKESDLAGEAAEISWIYDFPPPSGSHAFQLENRIAVVTLADSKLAASGQNAGTALVFSLSNQLESFDLRFPLYLPGQFVDVIGRGIDSYSFIATRNGVYAVQYINSDTIPATVSVILANEGIKTRSNWTISARGLYICTADGKLVKIGEGGAADSLWFEPIRRYIRHWRQEDTVVLNDPKNGGVLAACGDEAFFYDEQTGRWSTVLDISESAPGKIISGVGARSRLYLTVENSATLPAVRTAYEFDGGAASYVVGTSPYAAAAGEYQMTAQMIKARMIADRTDKTVFVALHRNSLKTYITDAETTVGVDTLLCAGGIFRSEMLGSHVLVRGAGTSGGWLWARIVDVVNQYQVKLGTITEDLADALSFPASAAISGAYCLIAYRIFPIRAARTGTLQAQSPEMFLNGCHSLAASVLMDTSGNDAQPLSVEILGDLTGERWDYEIAAWGDTA